MLPVGGSGILARGGVASGVGCLRLSRGGAPVRRHLNRDCVIICGAIVARNASGRLVLTKHS